MPAQTHANVSELRTRDEAAAHLRVSVRKIDYMIATGELRAVKIGARVLLRLNDLSAFINQKAGEQVPA